MKLTVVAVLLLGAVTSAEVNNPVFGYLRNVGVPRAETIRQAEEGFLRNPKNRIVGGVPAALGQYPYQAGLLIDIVGFTGQAVCGAALVSNQRLVTAAHCWYDGQNQGWRFTVVLGSIQLFSGGTRIQTSVVITHPSYFPLLIRNDIAVVYLPGPVELSDTIAPIALPSGVELYEDFAGERAIASGFGLTNDGSITTNQFLSHVNLNVITNRVCSFGFPFIIQSSHICTSGIGGSGTCGGDSGGPLAVNRNNRPVLVGITSFGSALGCQIGLPAAFSRVTRFVDFINQHL